MCRQHMILPAIALRCLSGLRQPPPGMQEVLPRARQAQPLAPSTSSGFSSSDLLRQLRDHPLFSALSYSEGIGLFLGARAAIQPLAAVMHTFHDQTLYRITAPYVSNPQVHLSRCFHLCSRALHSTKVWQLIGHRQLTVSISHDFIGALPHTGAVKLRQRAQLGSTSSQNKILGVSVVATGQGRELSARMSGNAGRLKTVTPQAKVPDTADGPK
jgi:hypothetical protein